MFGRKQVKQQARVTQRLLSMYLDRLEYVFVML